MNPQEEHNLLLGAVLETPEDDGARLVYADFLQEYGSEMESARGRFITHQVNLWQRGWRHPIPEPREVYSSNLSPREEGSWRDEANDLVREWGCYWLRYEGKRTGTKGNIRDWWRFSLSSEDIRVGWLRGFPGQLTLSWHAWLSHGSSLSKVWPITEVVLTGRHDLRPRWEAGPEGDMDLFSMDGERWMDYPTSFNLEANSLAWMRHGWPGITFSLPEKEG